MICITRFFILDTYSAVWDKINYGNIILSLDDIYCLVSILLELRHIVQLQPQNVTNIVVGLKNSLS